MFVCRTRNTNSQRWELSPHLPGSQNEAAPQLPYLLLKYLCILNFWKHVALRGIYVGIRGIVDAGVGAGLLIGG